MSAVTVRPMAESDFDSLRPLMRELHEVHSQARPDYYVPSDDPLTREVFEHWFDGECCNCVAELNGRVAGFFTAYLQHRVDSPLMRRMTHFHIDNLCTAEWARRSGVGRALMLEAERFALAAGADRLTLSVWAFNTGARDFYAATGFAERVVQLERRL